MINSVLAIGSVFHASLGNFCPVLYLVYPFHSSFPCHPHYFADAVCASQ